MVVKSAGTVSLATKREQRTSLTLRFAGDSGDGIQLIGGEFSDVSAFLGNDLRVLPDFPAEIRAPAGTLAGVSAYQVKIASKRIYTPGDDADALIAMNPAALKANLMHLKSSGLVLINADAFNERGYKLAGLTEDFLESEVLKSYQIIRVPMSTLTVRALAETKLSHRIRERSKNLFALGLILWLYERGLEHSENFLEKKFPGEAKKELREANIIAVRAGYAYGDAGELYVSQIHVPPAQLSEHKDQLIRSVTGNRMIAEGLLVGAYRCGVRPLYASYPITPASDILHMLAGMKKAGMMTFQAEDEMAAVMAAIGASYGGGLGMTGTSGPGFTLKMEAIGLAIMTELPLVIIDVQRAGPSTGMPTKAEQSDLYLALYGRHGEAPLVVTAASSPTDCFLRAVEACAWAVRYRMPVIVLSDATLASGSEPWIVPDVTELPSSDPAFAQVHAASPFHPYARKKVASEDPASSPLQREWAFPGMAFGMHCLGGLEKDFHSGEISYDGRNHQKMSELRKAKVDRIAEEIPLLEVDGDPKSPLLVIGWGGSYGVIKSVLVDPPKNPQGEDIRFAYIHLRHLSPFPRNFTALLKEYPVILVIELNLGQLAGLVRGYTNAVVRTLQKVQGLPFKTDEVRAAILAAKKNIK